MKARKTYFPILPWNGSICPGRNLINMPKPILHIFTLVLLFFAWNAMAQTQEQKVAEYELQRQAADQRRLNMMYDSALYLADAGQYELADAKFKVLLKSYKSIPSDLVFQFGKNSYFIGNYKQSVDWLNKYIQLKGTTGQYSEQAVAWLKLAEEEILKEKQIRSQEAAQVLSQDYDIDCGPTGKVTCPVCKGSTVIIKKGYIETKYSTCPYCNQLGYLNCKEYNQLLRGELQPDHTND